LGGGNVAAGRGTRGGEGITKGPGAVARGRFSGGRKRNTRGQGRGNEEEI